MIRNYFIIAWRNLWNNKVFSLINIIGLAVATAACLLIYEYISYEKSYDSFHKDGENIYRLVVTRTIDGVKEARDAGISPVMGWFLESNFAEIERFTRLQVEEQTDFCVPSSNNDMNCFHEEILYYVDTSFLDIFSFPVLAGNPKTALSDPNSLVITESFAKKYFNWEMESANRNEILNKTIVWHKKPVKITGVVQVPANSHLQFSALLSLEHVKSTWYPTYDELEEWGWNMVYYRFTPNTNIEDLAAKIKELLEQRYREEPNLGSIDIQFQSLSDAYLYSSDIYSPLVFRGIKMGDIQTVKILLIICLFILAIGWINYINLTTARAMKRAKEVGIKKIVGAAKRQLVEQFLIEALIVNLFALLLAITLGQLFLPYFEQLIGKRLPIDYFSIQHFIVILGFLALGIVVTGLYPALLLSSFKSISIVQGINTRGSSKLGLRKILVVTQNAITFALIVSALTMYVQLNHLRSRHLGYEMEQLLVVKSIKEAGIKSDITFRLVKNTLQNQKGINGITASHVIPGNEWLPYSMFWTDTNQDSEGSSICFNSVDPDYFATYGIKLKFGRGFSPVPENDRQAIIIMEQTARELGFNNPEDALGEKIYTYEDYKFKEEPTLEILAIEIIGIVEDFHYQSLKTTLVPMIFQKVNAIKLHSSYDYYTIKLDMHEVEYGHLSELITLVKNNCNELFPNAAFTYFFLDDHFNMQYQTDQKFSAIIGHFSLLAILIACLGMFGLSLFTLQQRTKEIGIRKVLGARVAEIFVMLSKDFIKLVILSILVATPIMFLPIKEWLQTFAYRIDLSWWLFVIPALVITVIALLTISYQSLKAAFANPVEALKYE